MPSSAAPMVNDLDNHLPLWLQAAKVTAAVPLLTICSLTDEGCWESLPRTQQAQSRLMDISSPQSWKSHPGRSCTALQAAVRLLPHQPHSSPPAHAFASPANGTASFFCSQVREALLFVAAFSFMLGSCFLKGLDDLSAVTGEGGKERAASLPL